MVMNRPLLMRSSRLLRPQKEPFTTILREKKLFSTHFDEKYEELAGIVDPDLSAYDKLLFFNHELFHMIETSVDVGLLASLYSSQLITKDKRSLLENDRYYFVWLTETISTALKNGEFNGTSTADELLKIYAMYERAVLYDWALCKGKYSLTAYSDKLLPHVLDQFVEGF